MAAVRTLFAGNLVPGGVGHGKSGIKKSHVVMYIENSYAQKNGWGEVNVYCSRHFDVETHGRIEIWRPSHHQIRFYCKSEFF